MKKGIQISMKSYEIPSFFMCKGSVCDIIHFMTRTCNQAYQYNSHLSRHFVNSTGQRTLLFLNTSSCIYPTFAQIPFDFYSAFSAPLIVCDVCPVSTRILLAFSLPAVFTLWYYRAAAGLVRPECPCPAMERGRFPLPRLGKRDYAAADTRGSSEALF